MSSINSVNGLNNAIRTQPRPPIDQPALASARPLGDRLDLSGVDTVSARANAGEIRADKVQEVKSQIANGTYETDSKLDATIDKLLNELA